MITLAEVRKFGKKGNVIPVYSRIPADMDTPVSAFIKLAGGKKDSFLLESIEGAEKLARYSFVGFEPFLVVEGDGEKVTLRQGQKVQRVEADPLDFVKQLFSVYKPVKVEELPRFTGGAVGYLSYDTVRWLEKLPDDNPAEIDLPMMRFALYDKIIAFDHLRQEILIIVNVLHNTGEPGLKKKYDAAIDTIERLTQKLQTSTSRTRQAKVAGGTVVPHYEQPEFEKMVRRAKMHIREGDIFQVVLSQRWHVDSPCSSLDVYRRLRRINPSPYMFLLNFGRNAVIGASPEMLVRVERGGIETRPIAGTRPRGKDERADEKMIADLLADPKEVAEHTMLLDLGRNDLGRVSRAGSVTVREQMVIEKYSHVIHLVSSVVGALKKGVSPVDGHSACFPAGTVSGAPKIRAMEIIDELEKERRGIYAGSIAYLDFWGNLDSCIAIRTIVKKNKRFYVQAGAGIVADSKPAREFRETEAKARALIEAIVGGDSA
ncbi:MAG: anthranilate synthase component I [candidate division Zixibacteria bacterium]|nr:anthranilate synthase component I [candidate division Zixibacteria bacterium]MDH3935793.1 anthranilate synthase component I [candidate division Zixibacteria bacterium]